jgi:hypothetical protein
MFSYGTMGTPVGFSCEIAGQKPPQYQLGIPRWCPQCSPEAVSKVKGQEEAMFYMYYWYNAYDIIKPHGSIWVVRMCCVIHTDPVLKCFSDPEGLTYENLLVGVVPESGSESAG